MVNFILYLITLKKYNFLRDSTADRKLLALDQSTYTLCNPPIPVRTNDWVKSQEKALNTFFGPPMQTNAKQKEGITSLINLKAGAILQQKCLTHCQPNPWYPVWS